MEGTTDNNRFSLGLVLKGMAMGIAEVIPGVSGGTIAFITGIYETLLDSIKALSPALIKDILGFRWKEAFDKVNGTFLVTLLTGMVLGILICIFGVSYLLEAQAEALWAFFFGLILASIPFMMSQTTLNAQRAGLFILGAIIAYGVTSIAPAQGSDSFLYLFFGGSIAICALILPGISGSFILLILGLYSLVIPTLKDFLRSPELDEFKVVIVFALGCLTGLLLFSRVISAAFKRYKGGTIALLSGFMLGSLNKIWPWRNPTQVLDKLSMSIMKMQPGEGVRYLTPDDNIKILKEANVLPSDYIGDPSLVLVLIAFVLGLLMVILLSRFSRP